MREKEKIVKKMNDIFFDMLNGDDDEGKRAKERIRGRQAYTHTHARTQDGVVKELCVDYEVSVAAVSMYTYIGLCGCMCAFV